MKIHVIDLRREFCKCRTPDMIGKSYSLVSLGKCNFRCIFCFEKGDKASMGMMPGAKEMDYEEIERFVIDEVKKGNPIKITGGEPSLFEDVVSRLSQVVKEHDGYVQLDTNGSLPDVCDRLSKMVDSIGLDLKGDVDRIETLTGTGKDLSYHRVLETIKRSNEWECKVEFKTIIFDFTDLGHLEGLYQILPKKAYWELKSYRPHEGVERSPKDVDLNPPSKGHMIGLVNEMVKRHPDLKDRIVAIHGSSKDYGNFHYPEGYVPEKMRALMVDRSGSR